MLSIERSGRWIRLHYKGLSLTPNILSGTHCLSHVWRAKFLEAVHFVSSQSINRNILWENQRFLQKCNTVFIMPLSGPLLRHYCLTSASLFAHVSLTYGKRQIIGTPYIHSLSDANCPQPISSEAGTPTSLGTRWRSLGKLFSSSMCRSIRREKQTHLLIVLLGERACEWEQRNASSNRVSTS